MEWPSQDNSNLKMRKSKSLPDSGTHEVPREITTTAVEEENKSEKKSKKKKKGKLTKKAKAVSNARIFIQRD